MYDVLNTTYLNFDNLEKYKGNATFEKANFLEITREMERLIPMVSPYYRWIMSEVNMKSELNDIIELKFN